MENISLEQIDMIMERTNATYAEAKEALEQCNGDVLDALVLLEKEDKVNTRSGNTSNINGSTLKESAKSACRKIHSSRFILKKNDKVFIDIPLSIALIGILFCFYVSIFALIIAYCCGFRIIIVGPDNNVKEFGDTVDLSKH